MGNEMAANRVKEKCHICDKPSEVLVDDDPFGLICIICEDKIYGNWMAMGEEYPLTEH